MGLQPSGVSVPSAVLNGRDLSRKVVESSKRIAGKDVCHSLGSDYKCRQAPEKVHGWSSHIKGVRDLNEGSTQ